MSLINSKLILNTETCKLFKRTQTFAWHEVLESVPGSYQVFSSFDISKARQYVGECKNKWHPVNDSFQD